jgi:hypothetical protein
MILTGKDRRTRRKTCPSATLFTTNPTWIYQGMNLRLRGKRLTTNGLSHGKANYRYTQKLQSALICLRVYTALQPTQTALLKINIFQNNIQNVKWGLMMVYKYPPSFLPSLLSGSTVLQRTFVASQTGGSLNSR